MRRLPFTEPEHLEAAAAAASETLEKNGVILLPTETFYGLGAKPDCSASVARVMEMKGRPPQISLPVLVADWEQLQQLVEVPEEHRVRLSRSWPGALTVILPLCAPVAAASAATLAVRIPGHAMLRALLYKVGPLTGTSANAHGAEACSQVDAALASLSQPPDLVLDGGETAGEAPSTLLDLSSGEPEILRQGAVEWNDFYAQFKPF